jgi:small subunit ribosomal protein S3
MGQKVNPHGLRVGIIKDWDSKWYADKKTFNEYLVEDFKIREYLKEKLYISGVSKIEIERAASKIKVSIFTAKPGMVIGRGGSGVEELRLAIEKTLRKSRLLSLTHNWLLRTLHHSLREGLPSEGQ